MDSGEPIPRIEYTAEERETWSVVYKELMGFLPELACRQHVDILPLLERECGYRQDNIPQLEDISNFLKRACRYHLDPIRSIGGNSCRLNRVWSCVFFF